MAIGPRLELRQRQGLALNGHLQQSLWLLRLSASELDAELARIAAANPLLRHVPAPAPATSLNTALDPAELRSAPLSPLLRVIAQLTSMDLPGPVASAAVTLVSELRSDGYLDAAVVDALPHGAAALAAVQACEPSGVGARTLAECISLQLRADGVDPVHAAAIPAHLSLFAAKNWSALAQVLSTTPEQVQEYARAVQRLRAAPFAETEPGGSATETLRPDLRLVADDVMPRVELCHDHAPTVSLDADLLARAQSAGFGQDMIAQARSVVAALAQRGATLQRVGAWLLERHGAALHQARVGPVPCTRAQAADALSLHPSTVGRAIAGKIIEINGRMYPIARFLSAGTGRQDADVSAQFIRQRIAALVASEPATKPMSDDAITKLLRVEGVDIARRTVAKYRQGLSIPAASARRKR